MKERLQKIISAHGLASRRAAEKLISEGLVKVNGAAASLGDLADAETDIIEVDGRELPKKPKAVYLLFYKPRGVVTTLADEQGRRTVRDCLPPELGYLVPVGRLDMSSEGLLLLTNDGELVNYMTHPSHEVEKRYMAWVQGDLEEALPALRRPIELDGKLTRPADVKMLGEGMALITIREGKNRQVRRMCEACGLFVTRLKRVSEGTLSVENMKPGQWRHLTEDEVKALKGMDNG